MVRLINAGADYLDLKGIKYMIERIYKTEGNQKMYEIKNQITKKEDI